MRTITTDAALLADAAYWLRPVALGKQVQAQDESDRNEVIGIVAKLESVAAGFIPWAPELAEAVQRMFSALIAVEGNLNQPYPDDPRWTPWTRFVKPAMDQLAWALETAKEGDGDSGE